MPDDLVALQAEGSKHAGAPAQDREASRYADAEHAWMCEPSASCVPQHAPAEAPVRATSSNPRQLERRQSWCNTSYKHTTQVTIASRRHCPLPRQHYLAMQQAAGACARLMGISGLVMMQPMSHQSSELLTCSWWCCMHEQRHVRASCVLTLWNTAHEAAAVQAQGPVINKASRTWHSVGQSGALSSAKHPTHLLLGLSMMFRHHNCRLLSSSQSSVSHRSGCRQAGTTELNTCSRVTEWTEPTTPRLCGRRGVQAPPRCTWVRGVHHVTWCSECGRPAMV